MFETMNTDLLHFLNACPTAFQAVEQMRSILNKEGYEELMEGSVWSLKEGGRYFTVRNETSLIAFRIPSRCFTGFMIAASHSDSPSYKVKPEPEMVSGDLLKLNVEGYGGMIASSWLDRPLSIAGRVVYESEEGIRTKIVNVDRDLLMIPNLAIHMTRGTDPKPLNPQVNMLPLLGNAQDKGCFQRIVAEAAGVNAEQILSHDLFLYVREEGKIWGVENQFLSAPHLDDLQCTYADLKGFLAAKDGTSVPVLAVFDNEEVGSLTKQGARSPFLKTVLKRIAEGCGKSEEETHASFFNSFMISADNAHAVHPNVPEVADPVLHPLLNHGPVIKYSAAQKYSSDAVSAAVFKKLCSLVDVPFQEFVNRSDLPGGSTLGNLCNLHVPMNMVDIGLPQLAMHSCYETCGVKDTAYLATVLSVFFAMSFTDLGHGSWNLH